MRILVVDDSRVARSVLHKVLGELGYSFVHEASDGVEALARLQDGAFDLVISDWNMPRMDGITLVQKIMHEPELEVPVLLVSAENYITRFIEVTRLGAHGYIRKPFTQQTLQRKIAEVMKKRAMDVRKAGPSSLSGSLSEIGFPELVQFVASCGLSGRLLLEHEEAGMPRRGSIELREGEVVAAFIGQQSGDDAVYAMAEWEDGTFRFEADAEAIAQNTTMPTLPLLVEAMKRRDERARSA
jgi:two-component system chemotaxis response regulator CheY